MEQAGSRLRHAAIAGGLLAPMASHAALLTGRGAGVALGLAAVQALAAGLILWELGGWARAMAVLGPAAMLAGMAALGGDRALLAAAGFGHALLYLTLLVAFAASLRPGRVSLVTRLARSINPHFHAGMVPYTRAVTWAWCVFAAAQLALSATLLAFAPLGWPLDWWLLLVGTLHGPMAAGLAVVEFAVRRWRWPGEHVGFLEMVRGVRASVRDGRAAGAGASRPAAGCPAHSGSATRRPDPGADSGPGPAA